MQTHNRYMNIIAIVIAAACLSLATACGEAAAPTQEATENPTAETHDQQGGCTTETPELTSRLNTTEEEYLEHQQVQHLAYRVMYQNEELFWRQPNVYDVNTGFLMDSNGGWTKKWGITVWVSEKVEQMTLSAEDRIPDYIDDVPIRIVEAEPLPEASESRCVISMCGVSPEAGEGSITTINTPDRRRLIRHKYDPLFWRQPNVSGVGLGRIRDENGEVTNKWSITVRVTKKVHWSLVPPEDRLPDCLEGIPVQVLVGQPAPLV